MERNASRGDRGRAHAAARRLTRRRLATELVAFTACMVLAVWSAAALKSATTGVPELMAEPEAASAFLGAGSTDGAIVEAAASSIGATPVAASARGTPADDERVPDVASAVRWFDGRRVEPTRTIWMRVTAYSPDPRSTAPFDDGITASLKSVWTNGMRLVAADPKVLPQGALVSVPGYHRAEVVPVLDKGGAIKGNKLDLLYPTHERALQWGVRWLPVTVWEYADDAAEG